MYEAVLGFLLVSSSVCCRTDMHTGPGRKRKSGIFVGYTVFLLLTVYNPLVVKYLIAKVKFENEYYRFIWILPVIPAVAYYGVRLVTAFRKTWIKVLMAAAVLTGFVILGNPLDG